MLCDTYLPKGTKRNFEFTYMTNFMTCYKFQGTKVHIIHRGYQNCYLTVSRTTSSGVVHRHDTMTCVCGPKDILNGNRNDG